MFKTEKPLTFSGPFAAICKQFIVQKQAFGYKYGIERYLIAKFDELTSTLNVVSHSLTEDVVNAFITKKPHESDKSAANRTGLIRQFAIFMVQNGYEAYIVPPLKIHHSSFIPYIYSKDEICLILGEIDRIKPVKNAYLRHMIYPVLFRMLYGCGFRINEALQLKVADVDLHRGIVRVENAKFGSERLVPMSNSLVKVCRNYFNRVLSGSGSNDYFFPAKDGGFLNNGAVYRNFKGILKRLGILCGRKEKSPRIHDLRHTFAVHSLKQWAIEGRDVYVLLPVLSTYLGHTTIKATGQYLRLTSDVYPDIIRIVEGKFADVIPEVKGV